MSSIAFLGNSPLASFGRSRQSDPAQTACSTSGRLCNNIVGPASSVQMYNHMSALSGRAVGSTFFNRQRRAPSVISGIFALVSCFPSCAVKASKRDYTQLAALGSWASRAA